MQGDKHPDTSISTWNLFLTLRDTGDAAKAIEILREHLLWLLSRDPATLEANQRKIREYIENIQRR